MTQTTGEIRSNEERSGSAWPARTQAVSYVGNACVIEGNGDFDLDDLHLVRRRFPDQRVTLDGDVITIWPRPLQARRGTQAARTTHQTTPTARIHECTELQIDNRPLM
ncbi:hypothetical protein H1V43_33840 [Streptomyces sp. PSKA54]|uniref:Uncharacterized protein n=1 Tax=Streptomyces himalayensis subsp. aureolus TaxID=2758039 RepID=A0A7W2D7J0_9ACTN|nr:hypothetical protein [Streptomyces himalayensis]MBA4866217.1 hypothetical protein [Streptomyces himalayensis subsp. aureolus]